MASPKRKTEAQGAPTVRLELDAALYHKAALDRAARAFAELADFEFERAAGRWRIRIQVKKAHLAERMADEFANHALAAQVQSR